MLQTLFHRGAMSRADLARITRLTRVTISDVVAECIVDGIVHEIGTRAASGPGKPAIVVDIDRDGHQIVGIDLSGTTEFRGSLLDLGGQVLLTRTIDLPTEVHADEAYRLVRDLTGWLLREATQPVLGVGIGTPGVVRPDGVIFSAPNLDWREMPLQQQLANDLQVPVIVSNDANAAVLAEFTFGDAHADVMLVRIGRGVGASVIAGGRVLSGARFAAGEIGHLVMQPHQGPQCVCGRQGCLETFVRVPHLQEQIAAAPTAAEEILAAAGERLGAAIAPVVAALDLSEIVIAGREDLFGGSFLREVATAVRERTYDGLLDEVVVRIARQKDIVVRGAAVTVLSTQLGVT